MMGILPKQIQTTKLQNMQTNNGLNTKNLHIWPNAIKDD